jgi:hypothetical protein
VEKTSMSDAAPGAQLHYRPKWNTNTLVHRYIQREGFTFSGLKMGVLRKRSACCGVLLYVKFTGACVVRRVRPTSHRAQWVLEVPWTLVRVSGTQHYGVGLRKGGGQHARESVSSRSRQKPVAVGHETRLSVSDEPATLYGGSTRPRSTDAHVDARSWMQD